MRIIAGFAYRYEPDFLIDDLLINVGWVDGVVSVDTRGDERPWIPKRERTEAVREKARQTNADWLLELDPDERLEVNAESRLRGAAEIGPDWLKVRLRELWTPTAYRIDRGWRKTRARFHRIEPAQPPGRRRARLLDVNLYHLKMIEPANRDERQRVHARWNRWDNGGRFKYLTDERGMRLEKIPEGREYVPEYRPYRFEVPHV